MKVFPVLPEDVIDATRQAFAEANASTSILLMRQPGMHEEGLDFNLVSTLDARGPVILPSGTALAIETHWLGGRRHWGNWEISDIAIVVTVRIQGGLIARKVALLQTKRLYSNEIPVDEMERADYEFGIGRLIDRAEKMVPLFKQRQFTFTDNSVYGALKSGSQQVRNIDDYVLQHGIPVYYAFYNPPQVPSSGLHPPLGISQRSDDIETGCRVLSREEVHKKLDALPIGSVPSFGKMRIEERKSKFDPNAESGWRLERFVADEVLRCREGRLFEDAQDETLSHLLYRRSAPIGAAIVLTIDLPNGREG